MLKLIIYSAAVLFFISSQLSGKTKPISGSVKSDSDIYLLNVRIESLPSKTTTKSDENGRFFFEIPIKDRRLSFSLDGFHPIKLNVIPYKNDTVIQLVKIIEVNYLDSINTSIGFVLSRDGDNIAPYYMDDMLQRGLNRTETVLHWDNSTMINQRMGGGKMFMINGLPSDEIDVLLGGVKINNIESPINVFSPISDLGLSEFIITNGGCSKYSASPGSINYIPRFSYDNKLMLNQLKNDKNTTILEGFGSLGIKYALINGGTHQKKYSFSNLESTDLKVNTNLNNYFANLGFTNRKNVEFFLSIFQNQKLQNRIYNDDLVKDNLSSVINNNFIAKIDQWSPFTGRVSVYGMTQNREGLNYDQIDFNDESMTLGFSLEKDRENSMITFSTSSTIINSDWKISNGRAIIGRQNSVINGSFELLVDQNTNYAHFKDIKMVFSKERTTDVKDPLSEVNILPNYWDEHSFQVSTTIVDKEENKNNSLYFTFGKSKNTPYLEDIIKNTAYSSLFITPPRVLLEKKSSFSLIFTHKNQFDKYKWSFLTRLSAFNHYYENKVKYLPLEDRLMDIMMNVGSANKSGIGAHFEIQPIIQHFKFATTISFYKTSDDLKFQLLPKEIIKNQIFIYSKYFDLNLMAIINGNRSFTFLDDSNIFKEQKLKRNVNYCLRISKSIRYKRINVIFSLIGENLRDDVILINNTINNDKKYSIDISTTVQ